ncbi:tyrosine-type recombinase/integrase [Flavobacterium facile]|uniref:tyrosine-type recombinase/integrase n=1 Tax=Flavobacterium facile TaxID=2893174 RepID=UPI002E77FB75|nr:tyrosine-type recombinase/integrase [Flavobacterium sp. T-12]
MKYTFKLKAPNSDKETLILFTCSFKEENKKFVYSTGEKINPNNFDFSNKFPFASGKNRAKNFESIKTQLNRYSDLFLETVSLYKRINESFTSQILKKAFDEKFKKTISGKNVFFDAYDVFTAEKTKGKEWSASTIKRYKNIKNILENFEETKKFKLTFSKIDHAFHREFTTYCMDDLGHINNTYARNLGLFKTFMFWAKKNKYTFNDTFTEFKKVERVITNQIALSKDDLQRIFEFEFESKKLERVRDVFLFSCVTGMRYGELFLVSKSNVTENEILLKEDKDKNKPGRNIPLSYISKFMLEKYDYKLPLIANQKQNEYVKEMFKVMEYNQIVQKITTKGKENIIEELMFYNRVSTHTGRRTFITMMKRDGKSDKLTASITGHTDIKTLNQYYQTDDIQAREAVEDVFDIKPKLKVV